MSKEDGLEALTKLIAMKAQAAIVMHGPGESADEVIENMIADGWTQKEEVDYLLGKRIRYMIPPPGMFTSE